MALTDKLTNIADAIRGKTGKTEEMTLDQMATEIAGIETGGGTGGSMESGELVLSSAVTNLVIPVNSKKNYCLIVPKSISETFANHNKERGQMFYGKSDGGTIAVRLSAASNETATTLNGASYWGSEMFTSYKWEFTETNITAKAYYVPFDNLVSYMWFAW